MTVNPSKIAKFDDFALSPTKPVPTLWKFYAVKNLDLRNCKTYKISGGWDLLPMQEIENVVFLFFEFFFYQELMIFFSKCSGRVDQIVMFFEYITFVDYLGVNCGKQ